jgi:hypothetical protein
MVVICNEIAVVEKARRLKSLCGAILVGMNLEKGQS